MERAATRARCPVASEVSGEVSEVSAMRKIGQLQGQRTRRPYTSNAEGEVTETFYANGSLR